MTPTSVRDDLEALGAVADADESGCYALRVAVPDAADRVAHRYGETHGTPLPAEMAVPLAEARRALYVGATGRPIRERLAEHARGDVRRASLVEVFDAEAVVGVYPGAHSGVAERDRARALSDGATRVWCDGDVF
jgi:hypothetical protein